MPILDLYNHPEQRRNLAHFAALASLAAIDGEVNPEEKAVLDRFASKLNISDAEYKEVMKKENKYPIEAPFEMEKRYERLFDLFKIIYSDHEIDAEEIDLVTKSTGSGAGWPSGLSLDWNTIFRTLRLATSSVSFG